MGDVKTWLEKLSNAWGVSGFEDEVKTVLRECFCEIPGVDIREDKVGNFIAMKKGTEGERKVMLAVHMDEIGLMVSGFEGHLIRFTTVGGFDVRIFPGQEVLLRNSNGKVFCGVIGIKPPHYSSAEERGKPIPIDELFIDLGMSERAVRANVKIGDVVMMNQKLTFLKNDCACGKALDNRACLAVMLEVFRLLGNYNHKWDVYGVATVQEESTGLGAWTSAYSIQPDVGIALDVTHGSAPDTKPGDAFDLGKGPALAVGPNVHPGVLAGLENTAKELGISYNREPAPGPTGTDAALIQICREGIPTALVSVPLRYMHSPVEVVSIKDIKLTARLVSAYIASLEDLPGVEEEGV